MEKFDYSKTYKTSARLITKFGNNVKMTREADMSEWDRIYDPVKEVFHWTNKTSGITQIDEPEDIVFNADGVFVNVDEALLSNSLVNRSDKMLLTVEIPAPRVGDIFEGHNGINYKYAAHEEINPAGKAVLYKIALRI